MDGRGYVFISYQHGSDAEYVRGLAERLTEAGVPVWFDQVLVSGDRWAGLIRDKIDGCAAFVVLMTPAAEQSHWVNREITQAEDLRKPILPLLLSGQRFFRLNDLQYEDVTGGRPAPARFVGKLVELTRASGSVVSSATAASTSAPEKPAAPVRRRRAWLIASVAAVVAVASAIALTLILTGGPRLLAAINTSMAGVAFSPDRHTLATAQGDTVNLWNIDDPAHPRHQYTLTGQTVTGGAMAFSPDGHLLAAANANMVKIWQVVDPSDPVPAYTLPGQGTAPAAVRAVAFSSDGVQLAVGTADDRVSLWRLSDTHLLATSDPDPSPVPLDGLSILSGTLLLGHTTDGALRMWRFANLTSLQPLTPLGGRRTAFAPSADRIRLVATGPDGANLWAVIDSNLNLVSTLGDLTHPSSAVAYRPDGKVVALAGGDGVIQLWSVANPAVPAMWAELHGTSKQLNAVAFSPDGTMLATTSGTDGLALWDVSSL